jgi:hypothetical protein
MALGFMTVYNDSKEGRWLEKRFAEAGKKLDMGKVCIRFKRLEDLPLDVIGELVRRTPSARYVADYQRALAERSTRSAAKTRAKPKRAGARPAKAAGRRKTAAKG